MLHVESLSGKLKYSLPDHSVTIFSLLHTVRRLVIALAGFRVCVRDAFKLIWTFLQVKEYYSFAFPMI